MNKEAFKKQNRENRIAKNDGFGITLGKIAKGEIECEFDNSAIWSMQQQIARELAPKMKKIQTEL